MKRFIKYCFSFVILILSSCLSRPEVISSEIKTIKIPNDFDKSFLSEKMIKNLRIIPLETTDKCLIGEISHIISFNNKYFIQDIPNKTLFIFDRNGKFIFKINSIGRGPGEFLELRDFKIDEAGNILILSYNTILHFDPNGKYIRDQKISLKENKSAINPLQFVPISKNKFYLWRGSFGIPKNPQEDLYSLYCVLNNEIESQHFKLDRAIFGGYIRFFPNMNDGYYMQSLIGNDTIFSISNKGVNPAYFIDFGARAIPKRSLPNGLEGVGKIYHNLKQLGYCFEINNILESKDLLHFTFTSKEGWIIALYSLSSGNISVGSYLFSKLPNSLMFSCYNKDTDEFISIINQELTSLLLKSYSEDERSIPKYDKEIINKLKNKDELSNPYLLIYKLTDF